MSWDGVGHAAQQAVDRAILVVALSAIGGAVVGWAVGWISGGVIQRWLGRG